MFGFVLIGWIIFHLNAPWWVISIWILWAVSLVMYHTLKFIAWTITRDSNKSFQKRMKEIREEIDKVNNVIRDTRNIH